MPRDIFTVYTTTQLFFHNLQIGVGNIKYRTLANKGEDEKNVLTAELWISLEDDADPPTLFIVRDSQTIEYKGYTIYIVEIGENERGQYVILKING